MSLEEAMSFFKKVQILKTDLFLVVCFMTNKTNRVQIVVDMYRPNLKQCIVFHILWSLV